MGASHHAGHCALEGWKALHTLPATAVAAVSASRHWLRWYYAWPQSMVRVRTGGAACGGSRRAKQRTLGSAITYYQLHSTTTYQSKQPLSALAPPRPPPSQRRAPPLVQPITASQAISRPSRLCQRKNVGVEGSRSSL